MKKILILILTVLMLLSFGAFTACVNLKEENKEPVESIVVLNGFNGYDDVAYTYLNPNTFFGSFTRNKDTKYIVEGKGSYKYYVEDVAVNQPNFEMKADRVKTNITDVVEFGIYIHSDSALDFEVIFKCQDTTKGTIYTNTQVVKKGVNNIVFPVDRTLIQDTGTAVRYYDLSFSGIKPGTTLYLDNLYAKVTTEEVVVKPEVQEVITGITNLKASDETAVRGVYAKYKALSAQDKAAVYNYKILRAMMTSFWDRDIAAAKEESPDTLVFFDRPCGEGQIKNVSEAVESYEYSETLRHGDDQGSMKLTFKSAAITWNNMTTTVGGVQLPDDAFIEFYIYNDSDQEKGFEVDWTYPTTGYITLPANEWTRIYCEAHHLTARGYMVFVGLSETGSAQVPEGALYFSSIKIYSLVNEMNNYRAKGNENTVFALDNEIGLKQVSPKYNLSDGNFSFDTETKIDGTEGTLKVSATLQDSKYKQVEFYYDVAGYNFGEDDLVYMQVYADLEGADFLEIRWDTTYRTRINNKQWGIVTVDASHLLNAENKCVRLYSCVYTESSYDGINFDGSVYFSEAKAVAKDDIITTSEEGVEYTFGSQQIEYLGGKGRGTFGWIGDWAGGNSTAYNQVGDTQPQIIDGVLRFYMQGGAGSRIAMAMSLKKSFTLKGTSVITITVRGEKADKGLQMGFLNANGRGQRTVDAQVVESIDGYTTYTISFNNSWAGETYDEISFWPNGNNSYSKPYFEQVNIADITYTNVTWAE